MNSKLRRGTFYSEPVWSELREARAWHTAAWAAHTWGANPKLIGLYRKWMRDHAIEAVRKARAAKVA